MKGEKWVRTLITGFKNIYQVGNVYLVVDCRHISLNRAGGRERREWKMFLSIQRVNRRMRTDEKGEVEPTFRGAGLLSCCQLMRLLIPESNQHCVLIAFKEWMKSWVWQSVSHCFSFEASLGENTLEWVLPLKRESLSANRRWILVDESQKTPTIYWQTECPHSMG